MKTGLEMVQTMEIPKFIFVDKKENTNKLRQKYPEINKFISTSDSDKCFIKVVSGDKYEIDSAGFLNIGVDNFHEFWDSFKVFLNDMSSGKSVKVALYELMEII